MKPVWSNHMTTVRKNNLAFHAFMVLFTLLAIPAIIITPFVLSGFFGKN